MGNVNGLKPGMVIELLDSKDQKTLPVGTLGIVQSAGTDAASVRWETDTISSITDAEQFVVRSGANGFNKTSLQRFAYANYTVRWMKKNGITEEVLKDTYDDFFKNIVLRKKKNKSYTFQEYMSNEGFSGTCKRLKRKAEYLSEDFCEDEFTNHPIAAEAYLKIFK